MTAPFRLKTMGSLDVTDGQGARVDALAGQQKRLALLVYLAVEGVYGPVERDLACLVFWPEHDQKRARANLRNALHFLRQALGPSAIDTIGDERIQLDGEIVVCDAADALRAGLREEGGIFLGGVHIRGAGPDFYDWVETVRARLGGLPRGAPVPEFQAVFGPMPPPAPTVTPPPMAGRDGRRVRILSHRGLATVGLGLIGVMALGLVRAGGSSEDMEADSSAVAPLDRSRRVLVIPFESPEEDEALTEIAGMGFDWFMRRLAGSGVADIIGYGSVAAVLGDAASVDLAAAADTAYADLVVLGQVGATDGEVLVSARLLRASDLLSEVDLPPERAPEDRPAEAFDRVAERVLAALAAELSPTWRWPPHRPPPSLEVMRVEREALDAFYALEYDRFHVLADSAMALDTAYFPVVMLNHKASAYWNQRRNDPRNFYRADTALTYLESQTGRLSPQERMGVQWLRSLLSGDLYSEFEAVSLPSIAAASERSPYRLAMTARRTNRLALALELIDRRYLMHPRGVRYVAWDQVHMEALARMRDFEGLRAAALEGRERWPGYGLYLLRQAQALAGLGEFDAIEDVVDVARGLPRHEVYNPNSVYNPARHLMGAAEVAYGEGHKEEARQLATRALEEAAELRRDSVDVREVEAAAYGILGDWDEAVVRLGELLEPDLPPEHRLERWGLYGAALAQAGRWSEARAVRQELEDVAQEYTPFYLRGVARWHQARIDAQLGDQDLALRHLQEGFQTGLTHREWEIWDIHLLPLHDDPRYRELTRVVPR